MIDSMLGFRGIYSCRLRGARDAVEGLYGYACMFCFSYRGMGMLGANGLQRPKTVKKNTINYHLSRMYPNIVGPRKRK